MENILYLFTDPPGEPFDKLRVYDFPRTPLYRASVPLTRDGAELGSFFAHSGDVRNVGN